MNKTNKEKLKELNLLWFIELNIRKNHDKNRLQKILNSDEIMAVIVCIDNFFLKTLLRVIFYTEKNKSLKDFLISNDALEKYIINFKRNAYILNIDEVNHDKLLNFYLNSTYKDVINESFNWRESLEGYNYWANLNNEYHDC